MSEETALQRIHEAAQSGATTLDLSWLGLTALPPEIGQLTRLQTLYLRYNQLTALPPEIGQLTRLQTLDLRGNQLTALPPEIGQLTKLQVLDLRYNQLTALPPEIWALPHLTHLDISGNPLPELPAELWQKTDWQTLGLGGLELSALPPEIGRLTELRDLDLGDNQLTALPPEIGQLTALQTLILWGNDLTALPPEIGRLTGLQKLDLDYNRLIALPPEIGQLTGLQRLALRRNQLTALPPEIGRLTQLEHLNLHGNPLALALPRELLGDKILGGPAQEILDFYRAVWQKGRPLNEARVLFVGQPAVGKTSLVHRLTEGTYQENRPSTMTVETHTLPLEDGLTAHLWDFGGQDFMHATHPLFFSARCVYVLVLNVRLTTEQNRVEYWLRTIRAFGGDAPVLVVGNQADAAQHVLDLPQNRLQRDFPNIAAFLQTSAKEDTGIEALRAALNEAAAALPHVRSQFAQTHLQVKAALEEKKQQEKVISRQVYRQLCVAQGIQDEKEQDTLLLLLHDLGVVLDFRNEAGEPLSAEGVLNPNWVTRAVYRLITDQEVRTTAAGRLSKTMARRILQDYLPYQRDLILNLLQRFELAYPAGGAWYLPNAMPQDEPPEADPERWTGALRFEYRYEELPESVITRFIVRSHERAQQVWRWGAVLTWDANRALVRAGVGDKKVEIFIAGPEHTRREFLAVIREHFDVIHKTFTQGAGAFRVDEFICPPEYPGLWLDYRKLLTYERDGLSEVPETWQGRTIRLEVTAVLNGFSTPEARHAERQRLFPEEERMAKEIHYHDHRHFEARDVSQAVVNLGNKNDIRQSITAANPEIQAALAELSQAVAAMLPYLSAAQAEETRDDLQHLQDELAKPQPSKKWYRVSIEGLKQAAKDVGEIGAPVITLAGKLLALLK